ncbi:HugZ family pyridoxamine 5'-phosphate oxidase [Acidihalobacter prosperus]
MNEKTDNPENTLTALYSSCRSLILATTDAHGTPFASPVPFVRNDQGDYFVFVSGLAAHTNHLDSGRPASILLVQDESMTTQIFARTRLTQQCQVKKIDSTRPDRETILESFEQRFGQVVSVLRSLPDFCLFQLHPQDGGRFVTGFGQAYDLINGSLRPVMPPGQKNP